MQRTRLGQVMVALGLALAVTGGLVLSLVTVLKSPWVAAEAAPALVGVETFGVPIETELAHAVEVVLPIGTMSEETAASVAARMVRDSAVVDEISRAAGDAHDQWDAGEQAVLMLDPAVVTPAAVAALRDIDLGLARSIGTDIEVTPAAIVLPSTAVSADRVERAGDTGRLLLVAGIVAFAVGGILDEHRDRTIRRLSTALLIFGATLGIAAVVARLVDVPSAGWSTPTVIAMVGASMIPLLLGAGAALGLGAFSRAVAAQAAPGVAARVEARHRAKVTPPPVRTGPQASRRRGKAVRQQAIDAFFDSDEPPDEVPDEPGSADAPELGQDEVAARPTAPLMRHADDGFHRAVDAVETAPAGSAADEPETEVPEDDDEAARERREAIERTEADRRPLRTHLPR